MALKIHKKTICFFWGRDLLTARNAAGLSQEELADLVPQWSQQYISELEGSLMKHWISEEALKQINKALGGE